MSSTITHGRPSDLADHVQDLGDVGLRAPLVDDGERGVELAGEAAGHLRRAHVGGHHHEVGEALAAVVVHQHGPRVQVVDRDVEEALELVLVEVDAEHAVGARGLDHVGHELGADRHARLVLAVLPRVAVVRHHDRDARRARPPRRVHQEQQLHEVVRRRVRRLDDEQVHPAMFSSMRTKISPSANRCT
jgi:hypothetical protein